MNGGPQARVRRPYWLLDLNDARAHVGEQHRAVWSDNTRVKSRMVVPAVEIMIEKR